MPTKNIFYRFDAYNKDIDPFFIFFLVTKYLLFVHIPLLSLLDVVYVSIYSRTKVLFSLHSYRYFAYYFFIILQSKVQKLEEKMLIY